MATMSKDTYNEMDAIIDKPKEPEIEDNEPKKWRAGEVNRQLKVLIGGIDYAYFTRSAGWINQAGIHS